MVVIRFTPGKLLEFGSFLPGPCKTPGKVYIFPVLVDFSWNFVENNSVL